LTAILISGLVLASAMHFGTVQAATEVRGIISSDTTWTKSNSPYILTGPVGIPEGVTLTIEPGVTVYLNDAYLIVNGTLSARGTTASKISLIVNGTSLGFLYGYIPAIQFRSTSTSWNEQTNTGSIIENAIVSSTQESHTISIINTSPKINNNVLINTGGQRGIWIEGAAAPIISNNNITSIFAGITISGLLFSNISENPQISGNIISGCEVGIEVYSGSPIIEHNLIMNNNGNKINGNGGIRVDYVGTTPIIRNNTIVKNSVGINVLDSASPTIEFNNIYDNKEHSIYLYSGSGSNVNATYNWWGTTDASEINQTIYDFKVDFNLGTVTFVPFLTALNPEAPIEVSIPTATPSPTLTPAPFPSPIPVPGQSFFFVESNSTISELFFNSTSSELSFTVSGESGTAGYVKVTIAKSLVSSVQNVKVYLDGNQLNVAITEDADSWLLSFTYMHSTHHVQISFATNAATTTFLGIEYWMWIGVATIIVVMGTGLLVYFKKRKH
jgi:parallel beta-helix repeat protein